MVKKENNMRKFLLASSLLVSISCFGQGKIDSLVQVGIQYHDKGEYAKAIKVYNEALKIDPKSTLINYELAMTYMYSGDYKKSIEYCDIVIEQDEKHLLHAYITKGSSLSNLGKTEEAIETYEQAIEKFGNHYLLLYNLAIRYARDNNLEKAEPLLIEAINNNSNHASSHNLLAMLKDGQNQRAQSLMGLYYFLLLEPNSQRAKTAFELLKKQIGGNVQVNKKNQININIDSQHLESEFSAAETMIDMLGASKFLKENKKKSEEELFIENTKSFFSVLGELKETNDGTGLWWDFYVPFFYKLSKSGYIDVFCYYISLSSNENATKWLEKNNNKFEGFKRWLKKN